MKQFFLTLVILIATISITSSQNFENTKEKLENPVAGMYQPNYATLGYPYSTIYKPFKENSLDTFIEDLRLKIALRNVTKVDQYYNLYKSIYSNAETPIDLSNIKEIGGEEKLGYGAGYSSYYAKHAAFVYLMGFDKDGEYLRGQQDSLKTQKLYSFRTTALTRFYNLDYSIDEKDNIQWRSKELIHYLQAYDLLKAAGVASDSLDDAKYRLQIFARNMYRKCNNWGGIFGGRDNHSLMAASALGLAAIVLNDCGYYKDKKESYHPLTWIDAAMFNI